MKYGRILAGAAIHGYFGMPHREWLIAGGLVLLLWCREIPMPRVAIRPIAAIAAASLSIYVTHFRIWPVLDRNLPPTLAYTLTGPVGSSMS